MQSNFDLLWLLNLVNKDNIRAVTYLANSENLEIRVLSFENDVALHLY